MQDSFLDEGFLLQKQIGSHQPKRVENARILIGNTSMDTDKIKVFGSRIKVDSMAKVAELEAAEKEKMRDKVNKILKHNITVFVNRQLIYNYPEQLFADAGVMAIEHADFDGIERLALVTGGDIVSTFDTPESVQLGTCSLIEQVMIGEESLLRLVLIQFHDKGCFCEILVVIRHSVLILFPLMCDEKILNSDNFSNSFRRFYDNFLVQVKVKNFF